MKRMGKCTPDDQRNTSSKPVQHLRITVVLDSMWCELPTDGATNKVRDNNTQWHTLYTCVRLSYFLVTLSWHFYCHKWFFMPLMLISHQCKELWLSCTTYTSVWWVIFQWHARSDHYYQEKHSSSVIHTFLVKIVHLFFYCNFLTSCLLSWCCGRKPVIDTGSGVNHEIHS